MSWALLTSVGTFRGLALLKTCFAARKLSTGYQTSEGTMCGAAPQEFAPEKLMPTSRIVYGHWPLLQGISHQVPQHPRGAHHQVVVTRTREEAVSQQEPGQDLRHSSVPPVWQ